MENTPIRLSPTAQTVLDSFLDTDSVIGDRRHLYTETKALADALRAAATAIDAQEVFHPDSKRTEGVNWCVQNICTIAAELERHYDSLYS